MRLLFLIAFIYLAWRLVKSIMPAAGGTRRPIQRQGDAGVDIMVQDPVCGVYFPKREGVVLQRGDTELNFCSNECKTKYLNNNL